MYWFVADTHFGHDNIRRYCDRPFSSVGEMDDALIGTFSKLVKKGDTLIHAGDIAMNPKFILRFLDSIDGKILYCFGNHDKKKHRGIIKDHPAVIHTGELIAGNIEGNHVVACHYAMRVWDRSHHGSTHVYGHSHGTLPPMAGSLDIGIDNAFRLLGEYRPFSLEEVLKFSSEKGLEKQEEIIYAYVEHLHKTVGSGE